MTRQSTKQRGISLVEVVLTLAISSMLIGSVLAGRNSIRSQAEFSDGVERLKETILSVKSEANTGNNTAGNGAASQYLTVGRSLHFSSSTTSNMADTKTLLCETSAASGYVCLDKLSFPPETAKTLPLPWGIQYTGCQAGGQPCSVGNNDLTLAFVREDATGNFTGYWYPGVITDGVAKTAVYDRQTPITLMFKSTDGRTATIDVNPATGAVTRTIQ